MIVDGNICKLKAGVINVEAASDFTILTRRKITAAMRLFVVKDKRYSNNYSFSHMVIDPL